MSSHQIVRSVENYISIQLTTSITDEQRKIRAAFRMKYRHQMYTSEEWRIAYFAFLEGWNSCAEHLLRRQG